MSKHILVVEDDADDREIFADVVKATNLDVTVEFATDGVECLKQLQAMPFHPDLILLDINMPKMDGEQVLRYLKGHPEFKGIPVTIFTTTSGEITKRKFLALGADGFATKPARYEQFIRLVASLVGVEV